MATYSPIYSSVWDDPDLEGETFEVHAFFVFLWSNRRIRPSGIYRATDEQLSADAKLPPKTVRRYLAALEDRRRIVRDGAWLFVRGYFGRQPNHENLRRGVQRDIAECTSLAVLDAWGNKYPLLSQWSADRRATIDRPLNENRPTEQLQSRAVQSSTEQEPKPPPTATVPSAPSNGASAPHPFKIPDSIRTALGQCRHFATVPRLQAPEFWQTQIRARGEVNFPVELLEAEGWIVANPQKAPKSDYPAFLNRWFKRAADRLRGEG